MLPRPLYQSSQPSISQQSWYASSYTQNYKPSTSSNTSTFKLPSRTHTRNCANITPKEQITTDSKTQLSLDNSNRTPINNTQTENASQQQQQQQQQWQQYADQSYPLDRLESLQQALDKLQAGLVGQLRLIDRQLNVYEKQARAMRDQAAREGGDAEEMLWAGTSIENIQDTLEKFEQYVAEKELQTRQGNIMRKRVKEVPDTNTVSEDDNGASGAAVDSIGDEQGDQAQSSREGEIVAEPIDLVNKEHDREENTAVDMVDEMIINSSSSSSSRSSSSSAEKVASINENSTVGSVHTAGLASSIADRAGRKMSDGSHNEQSNKAGEKIAQSTSQYDGVTCQNAKINNVDQDSGRNQVYTKNSKAKQKEAFLAQATDGGSVMREREEPQGVESQPGALQSHKHLASEHATQLSSPLESSTPSRNNLEGKQTYAENERYKVCQHVYNHCQHQVLSVMALSDAVSSFVSAARTGELALDENIKARDEVGTRARIGKVVRHGKFGRGRTAEEVAQSAEQRRKERGGEWSLQVNQIGLNSASSDAVADVGEVRRIGQFVPQRQNVQDTYSPVDCQVHDSRDVLFSNEQLFNGGYMAQGGAALYRLQYFAGIVENSCKLTAKLDANEELESCFTVDIPNTLVFSLAEFLECEPQYTDRSRNKAAGQKCVRVEGSKMFEHIKPKVLALLPFIQFKRVELIAFIMINELALLMANNYRLQRTSHKKRFVKCFQFLELAGQPMSYDSNKNYMQLLADCYFKYRQIGSSSKISVETTIKRLQLVASYRDRSLIQNVKPLVTFVLGADGSTSGSGDVWSQKNYSSAEEYTYQQTVHNGQQFNFAFGQAVLGPGYWQGIFETSGFQFSLIYGRKKYLKGFNLVMNFKQFIKIRKEIAFYLCHELQALPASMVSKLYASTYYSEQTIEEYRVLKSRDRVVLLHMLQFLDRPYGLPDPYMNERMQLTMALELAFKYEFDRSLAAQRVFDSVVHTSLITEKAKQMVREYLQSQV